ncbi:MAG: hypothetical protein NT038_11240 [Euryarchaeota archaeon]|nr:hypothetical protein [Euryarchaeota archaeon]
MFSFGEIACANDAVENDYGWCRCYFSRDNTTWQEATVNYVALKRGEAFYVKAVVRAKRDLNAFGLHLCGFAGSSDFDVIAGPSTLDGTYILYKPITNENYTYLWNVQVKPDTNWVNGSSPLNIDVVFTKDGNNIIPPFTIVNVYILDELWEGYHGEHNGKNNDNSTDRSLPGFEGIIIFFAIGVSSVLKRIRIII